MTRRLLSLLVLVTVSMTLVTAVFALAAQPLTAPSTWPDPVSNGIYANRRSDGVVSVAHSAVFGPWSCTTMGDPFSPDASPWDAGPYTYTYRIRIPADYPYDIVRVELLDPDSINQSGTTFIVQHTALAIAQGMPTTQTLSCSGGDAQQYQPCLLTTGEGALPDLLLDEVNPLWFVRMDENRTGVTGSNSGCGVPASYNPAVNTQTFYRLYYQAGTMTASQPVDLAFYTGQVGNGIFDNGNHQTDLQWVSPGGSAALGQPASVPTNCGSPNGGDYDPLFCPGGSAPAPGNGFEVDLTQAVPGIIVDPTNGDRWLYLGITTISGASENGFAIWAGPNIYTGTFASDANLRNVQILDVAGAHDSLGVTVLAETYAPVNNNYTQVADTPLAYIGPEYAGQVMTITLFDTDSGAQPPIHFYFDSIPFADWHVTFDESDLSGRCFIGLCNNQWVTPPYTFTVPGNLTSCQDASLDEPCTPFSGGRLIANFAGGLHDTYTWQVIFPTAAEVPLEAILLGGQSVGCQVWPHVHGNGRSQHRHPAHHLHLAGSGHQQHSPTAVE
ncbi:MAG: hypothetical protein R3E31_18715 [Chloroflexota bacterium]